VKSFTREFVVADEAACKAHWACRNDSKAFFCAFCGHDFVLGDEYRMVYTNDLRGASGNPLTCRKCWDDNGGYEPLRELWEGLWAEYITRFKWWAIRD
jgi:hypothetical protein